MATTTEDQHTMNNKTVIKIGSHEVYCYGEWREDSNCHCVFGDEYLDGIYADGGKNWTEVARKLQAYALRNGTTLEELSAC